MGLVCSFCIVSYWAWRERREEKVGEREMKMDDGTAVNVVG